MNANTIEISIEDALALVQQYGPLAGPDGALAATAAGAAGVVVPVLFRIGERLAEKGVVTPDEQQANLDRFNGVLARLGQPQWAPSTPPPSEPPSSGTGTPQ